MQRGRGLPVYVLRFTVRVHVCNFRSANELIFNRPLPAAVIISAASSSVVQALPSYTFATRPRHDDYRAQVMTDAAVAIMPKCQPELLSDSCNIHQIPVANVQ